MKRRLAATVAFGILSAVAGTAQADCVTASPTAAARIEFNETGSGAVVIEMTENQQNALAHMFNPATVCDDASMTTGAREAWFRITVGGDVVCERTDVDPSFDPFFFGAGINVAPESGCGARFSIASIQNPLLPYAHVDLDLEQAEAGTERNVATEIAGEYWYEGFAGEVPQDTPGMAWRGWRLTR